MSSGGLTMLFPSTKRVEDIPLLRGNEDFLADLQLPNMIYARFLRSPHAHATIDNVFVPRMRSGVFDVLFAKDFQGQLGTLPLLGGIPESLQHLAIEQKDTLLEPLAEYVVRYVGQPYGIILAVDAYRAEDAAEEIKTEFTRLPAITSFETALHGDTLVYDGWTNNVAASVSLTKGDPQTVLQQADVVLTETFTVGRCCASPLETRGIVSSYDAESGILTVWASTQMPHFLRDVLANRLSLHPEQVVVKVPNLGGAFGPKGGIYPEDIVIPFLAYQYKRPIAWFEDRLEHFVATGHAREQRHTLTLAARKDGKFLALVDEFYLDGGAYNPTGIVLPYNTACHLMGPYEIPHFHAHGHYVLTHKTPTLPYRGAGRPEAVFAMERMVDRMAHVLDLDPLELRCRNFVADALEPYDTGILYRDGNPLQFDTRNFHAFVDTAKRAVDYDQLRTLQTRRRRNSETKQLGIGVAAYIEGTGIGPFENARVRVDQEGIVHVSVGASSHGQGHKTTLAQICAKAMGIDLRDIKVTMGDTAAAPYSIGTFASRIAVVAGTAVWDAARKIIDRSKRAGSSCFEVDISDIVYERGNVYPAGAPSKALSLGELVCRGHELQVDEKFVPETVTFGSGLHVAVVEVDVETKEVALLRYIVVHDGGTAINPTIVEGQIRGGVAQGIGEALLERIEYDSAGQMQSRTFMDYLLPTSCDVPEIEIYHHNTPSRRNPLGLKGVGEAGAIGPPAAVANAVYDALNRGEPVLAVPIQLHSQYTA